MSRLDELNQQISELQLERKIWLDNHFREFAKFEEGDPIYAEVAADGYKMRKAGTVTRVYSKHDENSIRPIVHYAFVSDPSYHYGNNTEGGWSYYYTHDDWVRHQKAKIAQLEKSIQ